MKTVVIVAAALALGGCGAREALEPAAGASLPPKAYGAPQEPTAAKLMAPPPQTRPARSDDLIESSKERRSDEFDLPPN